MEPGQDAAEWEAYMHDLKDLANRTINDAAQMVIRVDDLMEIVRSEKANQDTFQARKSEWRKGFID